MNIAYGSFINAIVNFLIIAFVLFVVIKAANKTTQLRQKLEHQETAPAAPTTKICPFCRTEIPLDATRCPHCTSELKD